MEILSLEDGSVVAPQTLGLLQMNNHQCFFTDGKMCFTKHRVRTKFLAAIGTIACSKLFLKNNYFY